MALTSQWKQILAGFAVAVVYFATAKEGLALGAVSGFATLVWPPTGIALVATILLGNRIWPAIFLGAFLTNLTTGAPFLVAVGMATGNTLEAVLGAYLLRRFDFSPSLERLRDVLGLTVLAAGLSTLASASIGTLSLYLGHVVDAAHFLATWRAWWVGDALGNLVVAPWLLVWIGRKWPRLTFPSAAELGGVVLGLTGAGLLAFAKISPSEGHPPVTYVIFPFLIWAALRFGVFGAVNATFFLSAFTVWSTTKGFGPFVYGSLSEGLFYLVIFQAVVAVTGMILAAIMTERKRAHLELSQGKLELESRIEKRTAELRKTEARFRSLIHGAKDYAILLLDPNGNITSWNEGAKRIKGYEAEEIVGQNFSKFFLPEEVRCGKPGRELAEAAEKGRMEEDGLRVRKDGSTFWANVVITPMREDGTLVGFSKITRDLTEKKQAEDSLRHAYGVLEKRVEERTEELREALQTRDEFLSIASHELKTPITSILLQLQLLGRNLAQIFSPKADDSAEVKSLVTPEKLLKSVEVCERQSKRLAALLDELLDLTRIRTGKLTLDVEEIHLSSVVFEVVERQKEAAKKAGSSINVNADTSLVGEWDRMRLEQIVTNLISNAIKYGGGRPIELSVERDGPGNFALLKVIDHGIGIDPDLKHKVFEPYERAVTNERKNISGLGLGLYITRQIVAAHGGTIGFETELGKGSTFTVALPFRRPGEITPEAAVGN